MSKFYPLQVGKFKISYTITHGKEKLAITKDDSALVHVQQDLRVLYIE